MCNRENHSKREGKAKKLLRAVSSFAHECIETDDENTLCKFFDEVCNILDFSGNEYQAFHAFDRNYSF